MKYIYLCILLSAILFTLTGCNKKGETATERKTRKSAVPLLGSPQKSTHSKPSSQAPLKSVPTSRDGVTIKVLETQGELPKGPTPEELFHLQNPPHEEVPIPSPSLSPSPTPNELEEIARDLETELRKLPPATPAETPEPPLFTPEEVRELEQSNQAEPIPTNSFNRRAGVRTGSTQVEVARGVGALQEQQETTATDPAGGELPFVEGQARGYTLLNLMQPEARATAEATIDIMLRSRVRDLYLGVLVDGSFSWDRPYFEQVVRRLNREGRTLLLTIYLSNGPTMRRYDSTPNEAAFNLIEPRRFRDLIRFDPEVRAEFAATVSRVRPIVTLNNSLHPNNRTVAVVMLEDNLEQESYWAMRELARTILGDSVEFFRNPCPNCYEGNDTNSLGDPIETHDPAVISQFAPGFGFSLDGTGFHSSSEPPDESLSLDATRTLVSQSMELGAEYFALWRADRQGLSGGPDIHPSERNYAVPTTVQQREEELLLRFKL